MRNIKFGIVLIGFVLISLFFISCKEGDSNLVKVKFNFNYTLTWNTSEEEFVNNNNYKELKSNYFLLKDKILLSVLDTTSLNINACFKSKTKIRKGDLSIILMNSIESIPFAKIFRGSQYDNFKNCKYPMGLFDRIERERAFFVKKLQEKDKDILLTE